LYKTVGLRALDGRPAASAAPAPPGCAPPAFKKSGAKTLLKSCARTIFALILSLKNPLQSN